MLKILVYGYSYGIRSSRKLERALYHNLSFMWLVSPTWRRRRSMSVPRAIT
jgi:transposase